MRENPAVPFCTISGHWVIIFANLTVHRHIIAVFRRGSSTMMFLRDSNEKLCVILNNFSFHWEFCWSAKFTYLINLYLATADLTKLYCANIDKSGVFGRLVPLNSFQNFSPDRKSWLVEKDTLRACKFMLGFVLYKVGSPSTNDYKMASKVVLFALVLNF